MMMMMTADCVLLKISYDCYQEYIIKVIMYSCCYCDLLINLLFVQQYTANIIILIINDIAKLTPITSMITTAVISIVIDDSTVPCNFSLYWTCSGLFIMYVWYMWKELDLKQLN